MVDVTRSLYAASNVKVKVKNILMEEVYRQIRGSGKDALSPVLFNLYVDESTRLWHKHSNIALNSNNY